MTAQVNYQKRPDVLKQNLGSILSLAGNAILPGVGGAIGGAVGGAVSSDQKQAGMVQNTDNSQMRMQAIQDMMDKQQRERQLIAGMKSLENQSPEMKQAFGPVLQQAMQRQRGGNIA